MRRSGESSGVLREWPNSHSLTARERARMLTSRGVLGRRNCSRHPARPISTRLAAGAVCLAFLPSCTAGEEKPRSSPVSSADTTESVDPQASSTASPVQTLKPEDDCTRLRRVPSGGQITYFEDNELRAASPSGNDVKCLVEVDGFAANLRPPIWNARADRVLLGDRALSRDGSLTKRLTERATEMPQWSRPSGTSVVYLSRRGALMNEALELWR